MGRRLLNIVRRHHYGPRRPSGETFPNYLGLQLHEFLSPTFLPPLLSARGRFRCCLKRHGDVDEEEEEALTKRWEKRRRKGEEEGDEGAGKGRGSESLQ